MNKILPSFDASCQFPQASTKLLHSQYAYVALSSFAHKQRIPNPRATVAPTDMTHECISCCLVRASSKRKLAAFRMWIACAQQREHSMHSDHRNARPRANTATKVHSHSIWVRSFCGTAVSLICVSDQQAQKLTLVFVIAPLPQYSMLGGERRLTNRNIQH